MDMAVASMAVINAVELAQCFALVVYGQVVRDQFSLGILLQEKVPELLKIHTQSMRGALRQVLQQGSGIPVQLLQPQSSRGSKFQVAGGYTRGRSHDLPNV